MGRKKKSTEFRAVGFRMPADRYELLAEVAREKGVDLSAVLNDVISEAAPALQVWLALRKRLPDEEEVLECVELLSQGLSPPEAASLRALAEAGLDGGPAAIERKGRDATPHLRALARMITDGSLRPIRSITKEKAK
jgi:hypothetical protein